MIDDHDRCEWVNVSAGTGSPGLSRSKSREPLNGCGSSMLGIRNVSEFESEFECCRRQFLANPKSNRFTELFQSDYYYYYYY